jgi:hypothetical protein
MARKLKKALKKAAKVALPMLAVAGLGKAFMNARNRKAMLDSATADDGFGFMKMKDFGPYSSKKMNAARNFTFNPAMMLQGVGDDTVIPGIQAGAKKGGRIVKTKSGGKAVRGFGKKKKQANRSKKK